MSWSMIHSGFQWVNRMDMAAGCKVATHLRGGGTAPLHASAASINPSSPQPSRHFPSPAVSSHRHLVPNHTSARPPWPPAKHRPLAS